MPITHKVLVSGDVSRKKQKPSAIEGDGNYKSPHPIRYNEGKSSSLIQLNTSRGYDSITTTTEVDATYSRRDRGIVKWRIL